MKIKPLLKRVWWEVVTLAVGVSLTISVLTACTKDKPQDPGSGPATEMVVPIDKPEVKPSDPVNPIVTPEDPETNPGDPEVNPEDPGTNPGDPEVNPEDPGTNPEDPGTTPETPIVNPEDPGTNPGNPETNPDPENPGTGDPPITPPEQTELDFSGLEEKIMSLLEYKNSGAIIDEVISFSMNESKIYILYDVHGDGGSAVSLCEIALNDSLETQETVDSFANNLKAKHLKISSLIGKAQSDITVNGVTYSKDGIEGDNIFARRCGVDNAYMTYVSGLSAQGFAQTNTGYGKGVLILTLGEDNKATLKEFAVEYYNGYTDEQCYENLFGEDTCYLSDEQIIDLGEAIGEDYESDGVELGN